MSKIISLSSGDSPDKHIAQSFFHHKQTELDELFDTLCCPEDAQLQGVTHGTLFAIKGFNALPRTAHAIVYRLLCTWINPWKGKKFDALQGANILFSKNGSTAFGYYHVAQMKDDKGRPFISLNYDHERNIALLKCIRGEARLLREGTWLARMRLKSRKGLSTLLYFTLEENV